MELWNQELSYDEIESIVMSREHPDSDKIQFHVLDWVGTQDYYHRLRDGYATAVNNGWSDVVCEYPLTCNNAQELFEHFLRFETQEGEGICFRTPDSPYKQGRSTLREQYLVKLSRYIRTEVKIIGFTEQMLNSNPEKRSPIGMMARRKTIAGQVGKNTLGAFVVQDTTKPCLECVGKTGLLTNFNCEYCRGTHFMVFDVGTGVKLTDERRKEIWDNRDNYFNKQLTIKKKPHGQKIKPRSPIAIMDEFEYVGKREKGY
jgi:ATP-dependent DNA ligase